MYALSIFKKNGQINEYYFDDFEKGNAARQDVLEAKPRNADAASQYRPRSWPVRKPQQPRAAWWQTNLGLPAYILSFLASSALSPFIVLQVPAATYFHSVLSMSVLD